MSETPQDAGLGELLVLMSRAHRSFATLRGEVRTWRHNERSQAAWAREQEGRSDSSRQMSFSFTAESDAPPVPLESEQSTRLWLARPDRLREEWTDGADASTLVQVGATWWSLGLHGAMTNSGSPEIGHGSRLDRAVLDPAELLSWRDLELAGRTVHAGREAIRVLSRASPRAAFLTEAGGHHGHWPQELLVDAERGVLLRIVSLLGEQPFAISEFTGIAFDVHIPEEVFVFEAPPGVEVQDARERLNHAAILPLDEVARLAPFSVFAFDEVPPDWTMTARLMRPDGLYDWPASVAIHYSDSMSRININVSEQAAGDDGLPQTAPDGGDWQILPLANGELRLWEASEPARGMPRIALAEIAGTRIQISTGDLALDALAELAGRLAPAPTEPPAPGRATP
jgi:outer membrane lipoprotein-sorting protein